MAKTDRILNLFPAIYATLDKTKLISCVVQQLGQTLEEIDTHLFRIQRAHRIRVAESIEDILRLAAVLNLSAFYFEDIITDRNFLYENKLNIMRQRLQRIASLHLLGLGTPWAIMECAAIFLNGRIAAENSGDSLIRHLDSEWFSHVANLQPLTGPADTRQRLYLYENPLRRVKIEPAWRWSMDSWPLDNKNITDSRIKLMIRGVQDRTILPALFCPATGEGIMFYGIIPDGKMLVFDETGARLDNYSVDNWLIYFKGGFADFSLLDNANFSEGSATPDSLFDGDLSGILYNPIGHKKPALTAPVGQSEWSFKIAEGIYDASLCDYAAFVPNHEPIGIFNQDYSFDNCVFDGPASAVLGMAWEEHIPCSFKLALPKEALSADRIASPGDDTSSKNAAARIASLLPRFKAAGIKAYVDYSKDAWYLGEGLIRNGQTSSGAGIGNNSTILSDLNSDKIVLFEEYAK
jgi:hypothetical protein